MNAMSVGMGEQFEQHVMDIVHNDDSSVHAVVITGAETPDTKPAFSAGGDLTWLLARCEDDWASNKAELRHFYTRFLSILKLKVPVIAALNGPAIGAGAALAAACDVRVSSANTLIGYNFTALGLHPGMGSSHILPRLLGDGAAAQILLSGHIFKGQEAHNNGLVQTVSETPLETALELANTISQHPYAGVSTLTETLRAQKVLGLEGALTKEAEGQATCFLPEHNTHLKQTLTKLLQR
jgi:enoyl-CoA hydratase/carnithine racemase